MAGRAREEAGVRVAGTNMGGAVEKEVVTEGFFLARMVGWWKCESESVFDFVCAKCFLRVTTAQGLDANFEFKRYNSL